jgi:hypothetical protein
MVFAERFGYKLSTLLDYTVNDDLPVFILLTHLFLFFCSSQMLHLLSILTCPHEASTLTRIVLAEQVVLEREGLATSLMTDEDEGIMKPSQRPICKLE